MRTFKDNEGREWTVQVNYSARERVRASTQLDLFDLSIFQAIGDDPAMLIDVLSAICAPQIESRTMTKEKFGDCLTGDVIESAASVLTQEYIDFFPKRRREMMEKVLATATRIADEELARVEAQIENGNLEAKLREKLSESSGSARGSYS